MKITIQFLFFLFALTSLQAQKSNLTEKQYLFLQGEVRRLASANIDSAFLVATKIENSFQVHHKAFGKATLAYLYQNKGDTVSANLKLNEAVLLSEKIISEREKLTILSFLCNYSGIIDWQRGKLSKAIVNFQKGKEFSKRIGDVKQLIKFEMNTAVVNNEIGNFKLAIKILKASEKIIDKNEKLFNEDEFQIIKSNLYLNLGKNYEYFFKKEAIAGKKYIDSALQFYKKALVFSKKSPISKIRAQNNIAGVYSQLSKYKEAISVYQNLITECTENDLQDDFYIASYNLGYMYFLEKKYNKALVYFQKVDSIYAINNSKVNEYAFSQYYQSKIYDSYKDYSKATNYANQYLAILEKNETKLNEETEKINGIQNNATLKNEMLVLSNKYRKEFYFKMGLIILVVIIFFLTFFLLLRSIKQRKKAEARFHNIIQEFQKKSENNLELTAEISIPDNELEIHSKSPNLSLDEEKEKEILEKLKNIEEKLTFLNKDFTLQYLAKKIKTNTTYLSYVVNKNFGKSFSEYANELKINYVINQMISNPQYRKYSTQAIAESVGYKNAASFSRSFTKKTGLSPVQFANKVNDLNS